MATTHHIPGAFERRKQKIVEALATPDSDYTDLSPKGSVDRGIIDLIEVINGLEGLVTTSSCAGRISVFLEGSKSQHLCTESGEEYFSESQRSQVAVPGGKGRGGRWLFVSHDPVVAPAVSATEEEPFMRLFALANQRNACENIDLDKTRFVKFQFEPMILHIMAASLHHAKPVLSAAINAGFRESGVQSLKNLEDPLSFPMVAIRSSGLSLASIIGFSGEGDDGDAQSTVNEDYLSMLVKTANRRFLANAERTGRFKDQLLQNNQQPERSWENAHTRRARKRALGLQQQAKLLEMAGRTTSECVEKPELYNDPGSVSRFALHP